MKEEVINLVSKFGATLDLRGGATTIFENLTEGEIILDFQEIEFMSRSFADQLIKEASKAEEKGILVRFANARTAVLDMLYAVQRTQSEVKRKTFNIPVFKFNTDSLLLNHLQTL